MLTLVLGRALLSGDKMSSREAVLQFDLHSKFVSTKEYASGLVETINDLAPHLSVAERKDLCFNKLGLKSDNVSEKTYIQSAVEATVCAHFARFFPERFVYEEKVNPPKDVDCSFRVGEFKYNIEVKCADFSKKHAVDDSDGFKIGSLGRLDDYDDLVGNLEDLFSSDGHVLSRQRHMDNNLKDFLISAHEKFASATPDYELNILVVGCDDAMDMQKWYSYLYGAKGLFTVESYSDTSAYDRVDLVLLTNLYHRHKDPATKDKLDGHWRLSEAFCILCENPKSLKPNATFLEFSKTVRHHNNELHAHTVEGDAPDFILKGLAIPSYVATQLQAKGVYYFQPYESEPDNE
ncbi:hypothetical protein [Pseudomonas siliginis]|uniref:hypothetical protein n=1 Tax=Pseudomonas siliginis TaxID=2842346 RepID=UPI002093E754|nr:hypothetical protein [Pseudomonas siliginis]UST92734.1 hypothetical protein NF678_12685 [Pseudomonas siliginis]